MLGDLMRVAEEDKRLLRPASDGCFRFVVEVKILSTKRGEERQTREVGFEQEVRGLTFGHKEVQDSAAF